MKESIIQSKIIAYLKDRGSYVFKTIISSKSGISDIVFCLDGRFGALEVKNETGRASPLQEYNIRKVREAGGIAGIVRSVDDVVDLLEQHT